jgi:hypothetical protein
MLHILKRAGASVLSFAEFCYDLLGLFEIFG